MRVLTIPPPAAGHVSAMVPLCWALRAAGHDVLVAGQPDALPVARAAGLNTAEVGALTELTNELSKYMPPELFPAPVFGMRDTDMGRMAWEMTARERVGHAERHLDDYLRVAAAWEPDIILSEPITVVSRVLGGALGIPVVCLRWGVDPTAGPFEDTAQAMLKPLCEQHGLPGLPPYDLVIDPCPPSLQVLDAPAGERFRYVPHNGAGVLPEWATVRASRPRVCVCLGGTIMTLTGPAPLLNLLEALSGLDVEVIAALTPANREAAAPLPFDVRVVESLPLNLFLDTCDLLAHHGGSGTGLTATSLGVPQLVLPQFADEFDYGARLAEAGAGITIPDQAGQRDIDGIRHAVQRLLAEPDFRLGARKLQEELQTAPPLTSAVPLLEALV
ncbi:glycosyl transferase [Lentzea sp. NBRC 105346]|uniref:nucleotide disphospho-sugar-binding domain-containing protein n=1 Tax=Lentzea sp. NBRC 105346 TaxID=3032205 RepID=UPI0024A1A56B|nr:nucleotide disphospho-sugar-binding domain-containing protein [Lentzea sp. NBRC 105346]GLZ36299.1 glycosyl transferase [Lentzea sp. NBRC 105346]